jgi:hypothetical protein
LSEFVYLDLGCGQVVGFALGVAKIFAELSNQEVKTLCELQIAG